ncbi:MAG: caspase family protein [Haliscomenobacter sp.]|nr:caspase family protein [Haliscomenobacter sp.]MBK9488160.1 caspase family protein [Haliscomenobacter sp.]
MQETSLDFEKEIINYLSSINCRKLFLIDACHSGAGSSDYATSQLSGERMNQLAGGQKGLSLMMSCRANEFSYEDDQWQNGAFTQAMLHTIEQFTRRVPGIDLNQDGALDIKELYTHLEKEVPKLVQTKRPKPQTTQQPLLVADPLSAPIVLFQLPKNK